MCTHSTCVCKCACMCACIIGHRTHEETDHFGSPKSCPLTSVTLRGGLEMGKGTQDREKGRPGPFSQGDNRTQS